MTAPSPSVYVVDDDVAVLKALDRVLRGAGYTVRGFSSPREFLRQHDPALPGCAVLDIAMEGLSGLEIQRTLAVAGCSRPLIFLTGYGDIPMSVRAMRDGAVDFLTKPVNAGHLLDAVCRAIERDGKSRQAGARAESTQQRMASLTRREVEVLQHVIAGRLNKQIAAELGTAVKTIKVHRARVMDKMGVKSVADLVRMTEQAGIKPADIG